MSLLKRIFLFLILSAGLAYGAPSNNPISYIIICDNTTDPVHLMPLAFYEFKDEVNFSKLPQNLAAPFIKAAPLTFSSLEKKIKGFKQVKGKTPIPETYRYDPILNPPANCSVRVLAIAAMGDPRSLTVNQELWDLVDRKIQDFAVLEVALQQILSPELGPLDYRRFALYIASGNFEQYSHEQKIFFLKHHRISELALHGVSLDLEREIIYHEDGSGNIADAYAIKGSTFEGGLLDIQRFVSFYKTGELKALATVTPFRRIIRGQEFGFYIPADELSADNYEHPYDDRYNPRTQFYKNGVIDRSFAEVYPNFFNLITDIKSSILNPAFKRKFFEIGFWQNGIPKTSRNNPGNLVIDGKTYKVLGGYWNDKGILHEASFATMEKIFIRGKWQEAHGVICDEKGQINSIF